ncbi:LOW QUALITY PROTEIN: complement component C7-like [Polymixia lowei]
MVVYAQFRGNSERTQITCETTQACPLEDGCGDRFRCRSGKCIDKSLLSNGDQDCEEVNGDELVWKQRGNSKNFGDQCRSIYSGVHTALYRLPLSTTQYNFMVTVQNDFSDEMFSRKWHYAKDIVNRETVTGTTSGYHNYDFHETKDRIQLRKNGRMTNIDIERVNSLRKVDVEGGGTQYIAALQNMDLTNWEMYTNWAESVRSFPQVIKQKLRPVSDLVKEVQCTGVKRLYLPRAIDQYLAERHPCHCTPATAATMAWPTMEPQCFDMCLPAKEKCGTPPALINGFVLKTTLDRLGLTLEGHRHWFRESVFQDVSRPIPFAQQLLDAARQWVQPDLVTASQIIETVALEQFTSGLIRGLPDPKDVYLVSKSIEYTCTEGYYLIGNSILECTADQTWSGSPGLCTRLTPSLKMKQVYAIGEKITLSCPDGRRVLGEREIICDSSLHFSPDPAGIKCSEDDIAEDSTCQWPERINTTCTNCHMWETCNDQTNTCRYKDSADRSVPEISVCVRVGEGVTTNQTMSECETGLVAGDSLHVLTCSPEVLDVFPT